MFHVSACYTFHRKRMRRFTHRLKTSLNIHKGTASQWAVKWKWTLVKVYERVTGQTAIISGFKAVDDAAYIQRECGIDAISFGPRNLSMGTHGPDEYLPIDQLIAATKVLAAMIIEWCRLANFNIF